MRPLSPHRSIYLAAVLATLITACTDAGDITGPTGSAPALAEHAFASAATAVHVADVDELYAAVNDPANAGTLILLAPGTYVLSATDASGVVRPNGGRVELQQDMSIAGVTGDRAAVVI